MKIKLNEGESVLITKNHNKSKKPLSYLLMIREGNLMIREFGDREEKDYQFLKEEVSLKKDRKENKENETKNN